MNSIRQQQTLRSRSCQRKQKTNERNPTSTRFIKLWEKQITQLRKTYQAARVAAVEGLELQRAWKCRFDLRVCVLFNECHVCAIVQQRWVCEGVCANVCLCVERGRPGCVGAIFPALAYFLFRRSSLCTNANVNTGGKYPQT